MYSRFDRRVAVAPPIPRPIRFALLLTAASVLESGGAAALPNCSTLGNSTQIAQDLGMGPTPLPGNFFSQVNVDVRVDGPAHPYPSFLRGAESSQNSVRPFLTMIQVVKAPGVTEDLHYLAGNAVWSWQGGCPMKMLVIRRGLAGNGVKWYTLGPDVLGGNEQFNLVVEAGDLYAGFNSVKCAAFVGAAIAPGVNSPPEIETPDVPALKGVFTDAQLDQTFTDSNDNDTVKTLQAFLEQYGSSASPIRRLHTHDHATEPRRAAAVGGSTCNVLVNASGVASALGMRPTPLPGNFFSLQEVGTRLNYSGYPYKPFLRSSETGNGIRSFLTHIQVVRTPGVSEDLHYLAGDAIWSFQAGCPVDYLVIERNATSTPGKYSVTSVQWRTIGMSILDSEQTFSILIKAGDLYAAFNSDVCGSFIKTSISPGLNMPPEIETPDSSVLKAFFTNESLARTFVDTRNGTNRTLARFLEVYGKAPSASITTTTSTTTSTDHLASISTTTSTDKVASSAVRVTPLALATSLLPNYVFW